MKIKDILKLEKRKVDIYNFINRLNLFDIEHTISDYSNVYEEKNTRVQIFEVYNKMVDYRRGIWIYSIYFDNKPIAIWFEAGREGDDSNKAYIIDKTNFIQAIKYLESLNDIELNEVDINENIKELDEIYGYDMSEELFQNDLDLKFKVNDIVLIESVEEAYPEIKDKNIFCKILKTNNKSSAFTYELELVDYKMIPCFVDLKEIKINYNFLKMTDIVELNSVTYNESDYNKLNEKQKQVIQDYLYDKILKPKITLTYEEEKILKSF